MSKSKIKIQVGHGPGMVIHLVGGNKPYLWVGSNENYGYVSDRYVRKLKRFCDSILRKKNKKLK